MYSLSKFVFHDNNIFILSDAASVLMVYGIEEDKIKEIFHFTKEYCFDIFLFGILKMKNKLYFLPCTANEIAVFDLNNYSLNEIQLFTGRDKYKNIVVKVLAYAVYENRIYCFPDNWNSMLIFDCETDKIIKQINLKDDYRTRFGVDYTHYSNNNCYIYNNKIIFSLYEKNAIGLFDINSEDITYINISDENTELCAMQGVGDKLFILNKDGIITELSIGENFEINNVQKIYSNDIITKNLLEREFNSYFYNNEIYFISADVRFSRKYNLITKNSEDVFNKTVIENIYTSDNIKAFYSYFEDGIIYIYTNDNRIYCIDVGTLEIKFQYVIPFDSNKIFDTAWNNCDNSKYADIIYEDRIFNLKRFLRYRLKSDF